MNHLRYPCACVSLPLTIKLRGYTRLCSPTHAIVILRVSLFTTRSHLFLCLPNVAILDRAVQSAGRHNSNDTDLLRHRLAKASSQPLSNVIYIPLPRTRTPSRRPDFVAQNNLSQYDWKIFGLCQVSLSFLTELKVANGVKQNSLYNPDDTDCYQRCDQRSHGYPFASDDKNYHRTPTFTDKRIFV